jgi:hypothetical protein
MRLFFMHIPKTAGTSFRRFLERSVREQGARVSERTRDGIWSEDSESYVSYDEFVSEAGARLRDFELVCGHYPYHVTELLPSGVVVVTVLRDPLARCLSHVKHQMALERQTQQGTELDVNAFLAAPRNEMFLQTIGNLAVKYFAGRAHPDAPVRERTLSLDLAVARCLRSHFGFSDELDAFQERLSADLFGGRAARMRLDLENRSEDRFEVGDLTPANRDHLRRLNALDLLLDELMREVLEARTRAAVETRASSADRPVDAQPAP